MQHINQQPQQQQQQQDNQDQQQDENYDEKNLLEIIQRLQSQIQKFNKIKKENMSVVLIVGVTGSGKSTFFNFLSGADFIINDKSELEIKNLQIHFSKMGSGMNSITKELHFYHNQGNNHLIIDFPGFQGTNGEWDQLLFKLLFHRIVTSGSLKIIYVIKNPESSLPNRGTDLQEFIKQLCQKGNINIEKFNLLLNCYLENLNDTQLQNKIKEDLKSVNILQSIDKILVLRKVKQDNELQQVFNEELRLNIWEQIQQMQSIKIPKIKVQNSSKISDYITKITLKKFKEYGSRVYLKLSQILCDKTDQQTNREFINKIQILLEKIEFEDNQPCLMWCYQYFSTLESLPFKFLDDDNKNFFFLQIFCFFQEFEDIIGEFDAIKNIKECAKEELEKIKKMNETFLNLINLQDENEELQQRLNAQQMHNRLCSLI